MISLLLPNSEEKMSVDNKDIIQLYLGYNWQKILPINAYFVAGKQYDSR